MFMCPCFIHIVYLQLFRKLNLLHNFILPFADGESTKRWTLAAPALSPKMVTSLGFPPKAAMFF